MPSLLHNSSFIYRITLFLLFFCYLTGYSQIDSIQYEVEAQAIGTTGGVVPFWMRSNQYGSIPLAGASGSFIGRAYKEYNNSNHSYFEKSKAFDWGMGFEGRVNTGKTSEFILTEAYLKARFGPFQLKGGRAKETMGLTGDTSLTSGSFAVSGNALGIPKIEASIPEYYTLPFFDRLFAIKGNFAHGWIGNIALKKNASLIPTVQTYFHQKSIYGQLGRPDWAFKLIGGFNHQAFWGNEKEIVGDGFPLSVFQSFHYILLGKGINKSKLGNHLGSIDLGVDVTLKNGTLKLYRQNFYDAGALGHLANIRDGLTGISFENKRRISSNINLRKISFEFLYTKDQAGRLSSKPTPSGDEDYYNSYIYSEGWSYKGLSLGNPFLSTKISTRKDLISDPTDFFMNNMVSVFNLALMGTINNWIYTGKFSFSTNYGTYGTNKIGRITANQRFPPRFGIFQKVHQFSSYIQGSKKLKNDMHFGYIVCLDSGGLLNNSGGLAIKLSKSF